MFTIEETFDGIARMVTAATLGGAVLMARSWYEEHGAHVVVYSPSGEIVAELGGAQ